MILKVFIFEMGFIIYTVHDERIAVMVWARVRGGFLSPISALVPHH